MAPWEDQRIAAREAKMATVDEIVTLGELRHRVGGERRGRGRQEGRRGRHHELLGGGSDGRFDNSLGCVDGGLGGRGYLRGDARALLLLGGGRRAKGDGGAKGDDGSHGLRVEVPAIVMCESRIYPIRNAQ